MTPQRKVFLLADAAGLIACLALALFLAGCDESLPPRPPLAASIPYTGHSMEPDYSGDGTVLVMLFAPYDELKARDVVVYYDERRELYVMHRLVARQFDWWIVQGDNAQTNPKPDRAFVTRYNYIGKVITP